MSHKAIMSPAHHWNIHYYGYHKTLFKKKASVQELSNHAWDCHFLPGGYQLAGQSKLFYGPGGCSKEGCLGGAEGCCGV